MCCQKDFRSCRSALDEVPVAGVLPEIFALGGTIRVSAIEAKVGNVDAMFRVDRPFGAVLVL
jgi:hypothetical protein